MIDKKTFPLRVALSAPAIVVLALQQVGRVASPSPILWFLMFELAFISAAWIVARRSPQATWAWVPVMWGGVALGAVVDAVLLGGPKDGVLPLVGIAAPAIASDSRGGALGRAAATAQAPCRRAIRATVSSRRVAVGWGSTGTKTRLPGTVPSQALPIPWRWWE